MSETTKRPRPSRFKIISREMSLLDAVSDAYGEIQMLAEEMTEARDNMEEKFSATDRFRMYEEAADTLESNVDEPEPDSEVKDLLSGITISVAETVYRYKNPRGLPRDARLGNAVQALNDAIEQLNEMVENEELGYAQELRDHLEAYRDELQTTVDNLDGSVEFPGFYG